MGWETRKRGGRYYIRSKKVNGRVRREYIGGGEVGRLASEMDALEREERRIEAEAIRRERVRSEELDGNVDSIWRAVEDLVKTILENVGFHCHKGEWRRKRG